MVGHFGVDRTISLLKAANHSWRGMRKHVTTYCRSCSLCQKLSYTRPVVIARPIHIGGAFRPMNRVCVDTLDVVATVDGYSHVIAIMDSFTRWIELYPTRTLDAPEAATCLIDFIGRYGAPDELLSDNGSQYVNELIAAVLRLVGTKQVLSLAYSKEENGRIERANKEILRHLRAFIGHSKVVDDWVIKLPFVQRIMNASKHSVTGYSPSEMLFGNAVNLQNNILPPATSSSSHPSSESSSGSPVGEVDISSKFFSEWVDKRNAAQASALQASAEIQEKLKEDHLVSVDPQSLTAFSPGEWVLSLPRFNPLTGRRPTGDKLSTFWEGPFRVASSDGNTYHLYDTVQDRTIERHVTDLKRFLFDPLVTNPSTVAQIDKREFTIDRILDHRGDVKRKSTLEFLVRWEGYSEEWDLWCPWKEVLPTTQLRLYLETKNLLKLLPKTRR